MTVNRRTVIKGALAAGVATQALKIPAAPSRRPARSASAS